MDSSSGSSSSTVNGHGLTDHVGNVVLGGVLGGLGDTVGSGLLGGLL